MKDMTSKDSSLTMSEGGAYNMESLRSELRSMLEEVIQLSAYPKCILSF
jgi:hypothetical protein